MANLVIVESPAKGNTIKSYLGSNYKVVASKGHVRDLPKSSLGVDIENDFAAHYINIRGKGDLIKSLKKEAKKANKVFLATDPDREGEAISWHLSIALDIPEEKVCRVTFNEVTKTAVKDAIKNPRAIDINLVNSQQARRILDRIVGYKLSPFLWKNLKSGLSAGRVQSVATRIIVEREAEIRAFVPKEYWTIDAKLRAPDNSHILTHFYGDKNGKIKLENSTDANQVMNAIEGKEFTVQSIKMGTRTKSPAPPFITSTLLQEASKKLGFQSQRIMKVAQELYEGINLGSEYGGVQGLITYMRTDSTRVASEAQNAAEGYIREKYGDEYVSAAPKAQKSKNVQDAHEAIRPSDINIEPLQIRKFLTSDQYRLYKLIWERFVASQMAPAIFNTILVEFESGGYIFRTNGYTVKFQGYMVVYEESVDEESKENDPDNEKNIRIPEINEGDSMKAQNIEPIQHFTEPPPRYTEASLIKFLKEKGIGRPSTYTPIITTIIARDYVKREGKSLLPTPLGELTNRLMIEYFPNIVDY
ncbi:MAG: type I DNA topoisomerase, partial [Clostridiales bacterium]|nr:type I DNA topoisomerase [Clostridiales bacterium]